MEITVNQHMFWLSHFFLQTYHLQVIFYLTLILLESDDPLLRNKSVISETLFFTILRAFTYLQQFMLCTVKTVTDLRKT